MNNARPPPELSPNNQRICQQLVEREVGHCLSGLIQHFLKHPDSLAGSVYDWEEDIFTLCSQDDWEATWEDYLTNNAGDENKHYLVEDYELACRHVGIESLSERKLMSIGLSVTGLPRSLHPAAKS